MAFGWFTRKRPAPAADAVASQPPGQVFPWPEGAVLTAIDEVVLAVPMGLFDGDRPMSEFLFGPDDMQVNVPPEGEVFFIRLLPGMSVSLARSVEAFIVAEDKRPRRLRVKRPAPGA